METFTKHTLRSSDMVDGKVEDEEEEDMHSLNLHVIFSFLLHPE